VLSVADVAAHEPLLPRLPRCLRSRRAALPDVRFGTPLAALHRSAGAPPPAPPHGCAFVARCAAGRAADAGVVCVALRVGATADDVADAFVHVVRAAAAGARCAGSRHATLDAHLAAPRTHEWRDFAARLRAAGWDTSRLQLGADDEGWRVEWPAARE
jgi:hypothetical protein